MASNDTVSACQHVSTEAFTVTHSEPCGVTEYIPATVPSFKELIIQLGGLTTSVRRPSVHLCAAGRLCPRRPKQSLPGDGT